MQMERKRPHDGEEQDYKRQAKGGQIVKVLCPNFVTGSVIGKNGEEIKGLKARTYATINVAKAGQQFPGTDERPIAIKGDKSAMVEVISFVQEKIYVSDQADETRKGLVKLVIPDTSAGRIIGRAGETVKRLRSTWEVDVSPSAKGETPDDLDERIVNLSGEWANVMGCAEEILDMIVDDPKSIMEFDIDYSRWEGFEPKPVERKPRTDGPPRGRGRGGPPRGGPPRGRGGGSYRGSYDGPPRGSYHRGGPPRGGAPRRGYGGRGGGYSRGDGYGGYDDGYGY